MLKFCTVEVSRIDLSGTDAGGMLVVWPVTLLYLRMEGGIFMAYQQKRSDMFWGHFYRRIACCGRASNRGCLTQLVGTVFFMSQDPEGKKAFQHPPSSHAHYWCSI